MKSKTKHRSALKLLGATAAGAVGGALLAHYGRKEKTRAAKDAAAVRATVETQTDEMQTQAEALAHATETGTWNHHLAELKKATNRADQTAKQMAELHNRLAKCNANLQATKREFAEYRAALKAIKKIPAADPVDPADPDVFVRATQLLPLMELLLGKRTAINRADVFEDLVRKAAVLRAYTSAGVRAPVGRNTRNAVNAEKLVHMMLIQKEAAIFVNVIVNAWNPKPNAARDKLGLSNLNRTVVDALRVVGKKVEYKDKAYGPFYSVQPKLDPRAILLGTGGTSLADVTQMAANAGSSVVFGYGHSGSGKTRTLFGAAYDPGVVQLAVDVLMRDGPDKCDLEFRSVFELYGTIDPSPLAIGDHGAQSLTATKTRGTIPADPAAAAATARIRRRKLIDYITRANCLDMTPRDRRISSSDAVRQVVDDVDKQRIQVGHILPTPNNPVSSRGHLFIVLRARNQRTGKVGYLTFVDMGGTENPLEIFSLFWRDTEGFKKSQAAREKRAAPDPAADRKYLRERAFEYMRCMGESFVYGTVSAICKNTYDKVEDNLHKVLMQQGFFINETINHMAYFFDRLASRAPRVDPWNIDRQWNEAVIQKYKPCESLYAEKNCEEAYDAPLVSLDTLLKPNRNARSKDRVKMITVLRTLANLADPPVSAFAMLCLVNPRAANAGEAVPDTLAMAQRLSGRG